MTIKLEDFDPVAWSDVESDKHATIIFCKPERGSVADGWSPLYTASQMQQVIDQCNAKDAEWEAKFLQTHNWLCDRNEQLAAAQADNERLREALQKFSDECIESGHGSTEYVFEALATTSPTDALDAYGAEKNARIASLEFAVEHFDQQLTKQSAVLKVAKDTLEISEQFIDRHSESWYLSGQSDLAQVREAIRQINKLGIE